MAIFGKLADFSLQEILALVAGRDGVLIIHGRDGGCLRMRIASRHLVGMTREHAIPDPGAMRDLVIHYAVEQGDSFRFEPGAIEGNDTPRGRLLLSQLFARSHPVARTASPVSVHAHTRFILIPGRGIALDDVRENFIVRAAPHLSEGCCAQDLASRLGLDLDEVLMHLAALREARRIWPVRAFGDALAQPQRERQRSLAHRLKGWFRHG